MGQSQVPLCLLCPQCPQYQLPSQMNVLKLRLFMKDSSGKKNSNKTASTFNAKTALVVSKYWEMAGFKTWHIDAIRNGVDRLVKRYKMFKRFRDNFRYVDTSGPIAILDVDNKDELVSFYTDMLLKQKKDGSIFHRDDYREAAKLALILIGCELPEGQMMAYKKPGACHKARILAFAIYVLKILIFRNQNIVREICFSRREGKGQAYLRGGDSERPEEDWIVRCQALHSALPDLQHRC